MAKILAVCAGGAHGAPKTEQAALRLERRVGAVGDVHAGAGVRQLSLLASEEAGRLNVLFGALPAGAFGENLLTEGLDMKALGEGVRLRAGEALLRVTKTARPCERNCSKRGAGGCAMPPYVFAVVLEGGLVRPGDGIEIVGK